MQISFSKIHCANYVFIVINSIKTPLELSNAQISFLCCQKMGIGADGVLQIENFYDNNIFVKQYTKSGKLTLLCDIGAKCTAFFSFISNMTNGDSVLVKNAATSISVRKESLPFLTTKYSIASFLPQDIGINYPTPIIQGLIEVNGGAVTVSVVFANEPYCTCFCDNLDYVDIYERGEAFQKNSIFPRGINVVFIQLVNHAELRLRVYKKDIGECACCGNAALAAATVFYKNTGYTNDIKLHFYEGDITVKKLENQILIKSEAQLLFDGQINIKE